MNFLTRSKIWTRNIAIPKLLVSGLHNQDLRTNLRETGRFSSIKSLTGDQYSKIAVYPRQCKSYLRREKRLFASISNIELREYMDNIVPRRWVHQLTTMQIFEFRLAYFSKGYDTISGKVNW